MRLPIRSFGLPLLLALGGCDPAFAIGMRQGLAPPATATCVEATLRTSPRVTEVTPYDYASYPIFGVTLRDTTARWGQRPTTVELETRDSSQTLRVKFQWMGFGGSVPLDQQERMLAIATDLLAELRTACAPTATTRVECFKGGFGGPTACPSK